MTKIYPIQNRLTFDGLSEPVQNKKEGVRFHGYTKTLMIRLQNCLSQYFPCCFSKIEEYKYTEENVEKVVYINMKSFKHMIERFGVTLCKDGAGNIDIQASIDAAKAQTK